MDGLLERPISRRRFLAASAAGGAAVLLGGAGAAVRATPTKPLLDEQAPWFEASIRDLGRLMRHHELTSQDLTGAYLDRIAALNPALHAVIQTNPDALDIAPRRDAERHAGHVRGPLHGIPVLLKDNIATDDAMETTAGSLALVGSRVPRDADDRGPASRGRRRRPRQGEPVRVGQLPGQVPPTSRSRSSTAGARGAGSRATRTSSLGPVRLELRLGGRRGRQPVRDRGRDRDRRLDRLPGRQQRDRRAQAHRSGSSPQDGIIPIAHSQDTAGPMARTVTDVALLLNAMNRRSGGCAASELPHDYTRFLRRGALKGARIGVDRRLFDVAYFADPDLNVITEARPRGHGLARGDDRRPGRTDPTRSPSATPSSRSCCSSSSTTSGATCAGCTTPRCDRWPT